MPAVGESAPDFELVSDEGRPVRLSDFRGKNVILYFYPQDFTSGCEMQACAFRDSYPDIRAKDAVVLGISPDDTESHRNFREALRLPFHLLSDPDFTVAQAWGSAAMRNSGDDTGLRVQRGQYVIDRTGKIVAAQAPVKAAESRRLALEALDELG